jgi:hypothetical protein
MESPGTARRNSLFAFGTENGLKVKKRGNSRNETPPENVIYFSSQMNIALGIPNGTLPSSDASTLRALAIVWMAEMSCCCRVSGVNALTAFAFGP